MTAVTLPPLPLFILPPLPEVLVPEVLVLEVPEVPPLVPMERHFAVSLDGWHPPVRDGYYEWRSADDGSWSRLWWSTASQRVMAVGGHCPPLVWDAWRGCVAQEDAAL